VRIGGCRLWPLLDGHGYRQRRNALDAPSGNHVQRISSGTVAAGTAPVRFLLEPVLRAWSFLGYGGRRRSGLAGPHVADFSDPARTRIPRFPAALDGARFANLGFCVVVLHLFKFCASCKDFLGLRLIAL